MTGRIVVSEFVSVDGFYGNTDGGLEWVVADDEHHDYSIQLLESTSLLLFGRTTWTTFHDYWPGRADDDGAPQHEREVAGLLDRTPKIVFSTSRSTTATPEEWGTTVLSEVDRETVARLRAQADENVVVFGSGRLVWALQRLGLVDEYHLLVQPVALGAGLPLFEPGHRAELVLDRAEALRSGVVRHYYRPSSSPVRRINYAS